MRFLFIVAVFAISSTSLYAEDASTVYEARYRLTGYFLRAANVCMADKSQINAAFAFVESDEMKAFSHAFPKITRGWMAGGASWFNASVMQDGLQSACDRALDRLRKAQERAR